MKNTIPSYVLLASVFMLLVLGLILRARSQVAQNTGFAKSDQKYPRVEPDEALVNEIHSKVQSHKIRSNTEGDTLIVDNSDYQIIYLANNGEFIISILNSDFETTKVKAEADFYQVLTIDKPTACKFAVYISTPAYANKEKSGVVYGLSWCQT